MRRPFLSTLVAALFVVLLGPAPTKSAPSPPKEGDVYVGSIRFGDRDWPLPEGSWELLAYMPKLNPNGVRAFRVALARYGERRKFEALVMFAVGEVGDRPGSDASTSGECDPPKAPYQGEKAVRDAESDYSCWKLGTIDRTNLPPDPVSDVIRLKIPSEETIGLLPAVSSVTKRNGVIAHTFVWLRTERLYSGARDGKEIPLALWPGGPRSKDAFEGLRLSIMLMLREWAIHWDQRVRDGMVGPAASAAESTAAPAPLRLPRLQNPKRDIPMLPDLGIRADDVFSDVAPIGPFLVPLPPGKWKAVLRNPQVYSDGATAIDQVTLVRIADHALEGMIQIEARFLDPQAESICAQKRAIDLASYRGPDDYCAVINPTEISPEDSRFPLYRELVARGMTNVPPQLIGSFFAFSNKLVSLYVFVGFSPERAGLPAPKSYRAGAVPIEWTPFVEKWRWWTRRWAEAVRAGLSGELDNGPLPAKWRNFDLKSERFRPVANPRIGETYIGSVPLGGNRWPLPRGAWTLLAAVPQSVDDSIVADEIVLAQLSKGKLEGVVSIAYARPDLALPIEKVRNACAHASGFFSERERFELGAVQDCWEIHIDDGAGIRRAFRGYEAIEAELRARGVSAPGLILNPVFEIGDRDRTAVLMYGFPTTRLSEELPEAEANDKSKWLPSRGPLGPRQKAVYASLRAWTKRWHGFVQAAFERRLDDASAPWASLHPRVRRSKH